MEGTATVTVTTGVVTYGSTATLQYNGGANSRTVSSEEWITPFLATGGVIIKGSSSATITLNGAKVFSDNVPLNINSGGTLVTSNNALTIGSGNMINAGTFTPGNSVVAFTGGGGTLFTNTGTLTAVGSTSQWEIDPGPGYSVTGAVANYKLENTSDSVGSNTLTNDNSVTFASGKFNNGADLSLIHI